MVLRQPDRSDEDRAVPGDVRQGAGGQGRQARHRPGLRDPGGQMRRARSSVRAIAWLATSLLALSTMACSSDDGNGDDDGGDGGAGGEATSGPGAGAGSAEGGGAT